MTSVDAEKYARGSVWTVEVEYPPDPVKAGAVTQGGSGRERPVRQRKERCRVVVLSTIKELGFVYVVPASRLTNQKDVDAANGDWTKVVVTPDDEGGWDHPHSAIHCGTPIMVPMWAFRAGGSNFHGRISTANLIEIDRNIVFVFDLFGKRAERQG